MIEIAEQKMTFFPIFINIYSFINCYLLQHENESVQCKRNHGLEPHPGECSKFINCMHGSGVVQQCGTGTVFNEEQHVCDWPYNVDCSRIRHTSQFQVDSQSVSANNGNVNEQFGPTQRQLSALEIGEYISRIVTNSTLKSQKIQDSHQTENGEENGIQSKQNVQFNEKRSNDLEEALHILDSYSRQSITQDKSQSQLTSDIQSTLQNESGNAFRHHQTNIFQHQLRLSNGSNGFLEAYDNSTSNRVCDFQFGLKEATVACRQLGFAFGAVRNLSDTTNLASSTSGFLQINSIDCLGHETSLNQCSQISWGIYENCSSGKYIGLICNNSSATTKTCDASQWLCENASECVQLTYLCDGVRDCSDSSDENPSRCDLPIEFRLSGYSPSSDVVEGRAEVRYKGVWGTICNDGIDEMEAIVFCRSIGFHGPAVS